MNESRLLRTALLLALLLVAPPLAADGLQHRLDVGAGGTLRLEADGAEVRIETRNADGVTIDFHRGNDSESRILSDYDLNVVVDGNDIQVTAERRSKLSNWLSGIFNRSLEIDIVMPRVFDANLTTSGGAIEVDDLDGDLEAHTSGGAVRVSSVSGLLLARTSGGSITIGEAQGEARLRTSGGGIRVDRSLSSLSAHTSGGTIEIDDARGSVEASTSGGSLQAVFRDQPISDSTFSTSGGSITIGLEEGVGFDLEARATGGRVHTDFDLLVKAGSSRDEELPVGCDSGWRAQTAPEHFRRQHPCRALLTRDAGRVRIGRPPASGR